MKNSLFSIPKILFFLVFIVPVSFVSFYYIAVAQDRYESLSTVYITEEASQSSPFDLTLLGITNTGSARDILVLKSFIESSQMLELLDKDLGLKQHFANPDLDFFSKLAEDASKEEFLQYYLSRVIITFDDEAQLLRLSAQSFTPAYSKIILHKILAHSQIFIDKLNENISFSQLNFFENEVKKSEDHLTLEKTKLRAFQKKYKILSTNIATQTIVTTITTLESQLAAKRSELSSRLSVLSEQAPAIRRLRSDVSALTKQLALENARLTSENGGSLSEIDSKFQDIKLLIEYKTLRYKANLDAFEKAKVEAARRLRFLTIVAQPTLADEALFPNRVYIIVTTGIVALLIYFILSITVATIREHAW